MQRLFEDGQGYTGDCDRPDDATEVSPGEETTLGEPAYLAALPVLLLADETPYLR